ncbi:peptidyl-prolyl cis-trans isomerase [Striga asiatica]|uniref:peptidylprolyl isomerase n=1 Tax=Striga asiatica TaxID=4170 RepID=A0A5A7NXJ0_STRAF|nr:peptidyl-prolyl cis-trans isomerase [Striga asiatica]
MAFWGVEVKPGKPITHYCEKARGRLRISQATLGNRYATMRSTVQCNVGRRSPVLLYVLMPEKTESCHLDLEFEEADDVVFFVMVFSVIGPRSLFLSGYYVQKIQGIRPHDDSYPYFVFEFLASFTSLLGCEVGEKSKFRKEKKKALKKEQENKKAFKKEEKTHTIQAAKDSNTVLAEENVHEDFSRNSNDDLTKKRKSELQLEGKSVKGTDNQCGLQQAENQTQE